MPNLLSLEALAWLKEQDYAHADHETRMALICEAREIFEKEEDDD